jgi:hypothetical protein
MVVVSGSHGESKSKPLDPLRPWHPSRGRQRAARDKISTAFLEALNEAFREPNDSGGCKGLDAIKKVRDEDPATFARIFATLQPKQVEITDEDPISNLTDEQLEAYCAELERQIAERAAHPSIPAVVAAGSQRVN